MDGHRTRKSREMTHNDLWWDKPFGTLDKIWYLKQQFMSGYLLFRRYNYNRWWKRWTSNCETQRLR